MGFWDVQFVAPKVFRGAADVTTGDAMGRPGAANSRSLKDEEFGARRSKGRAIGTEGSIELGFGR